MVPNTQDIDRARERQHKRDEDMRVGEKKVAERHIVGDPHLPPKPPPGSVTVGTRQAYTSVITIDHSRKKTHILDQNKLI